MTGKATTEVNWLDADEARVWRAYLRMRAALDRGVDRDLGECSGLSGSDYALLVPLSEAPGCALRARDLGRTVDWERSRISHQIRRMEQRGLLERRDCPTDARGTVIVLTPAGREALEAAAPSHVEWVRRHFIDLMSTEELEMLGSLAARVLASVTSECAGDESEDACGEEGAAPEDCAGGASPD